MLPVSGRSNYATPPLAKVTSGSAQRLLGASVSPHVNPISAMSGYEKNAFLAFLHDLFFKPFGIDLYEEDRTLKTNFAITLAIALSNSPPPDDDNVPQSIPFKITNEHGDLITYQLRECTDGISGSGIELVEISENGDVERVAFQVDGTLETIKNALNSRIGESLKRVIDDFTEDFTNPNAEQRVDFIRYTFEAAAVNPEYFQNVKIAVADYKAFFDNNSVLTCKLAIRCIENPKTKPEMRHMAARYLLNNSRRLRDMTDVKRAADHVLLNQASFSQSRRAVATEINNESYQMSKQQRFQQIVNHPSNFDKREILSAAKYIIKGTVNYDQITHAKAIILDGNSRTNEEFLNATLTIIHQSRGCKNRLTNEAAKYIMANRSAYPAESVRSAAHFTISNPKLYTSKEYDSALLYTLNHPDSYRTPFITQLAKKFINQNSSFFFTPLTNQEEFAAAFENAEERRAIANYTDGLADILSSDQKSYEVSAKVSSTGSKQKLSVHGLWLEKKFSHALEANVNIGAYILQSWNHAAIKIWHSKQASTLNVLPPDPINA
ncbi:MAG: hypothetical protein K0R08_442 [Solimicrobium sp.]|jgi:hypothetical protein|nr:hypothetical protein [Solimicrobium sp.]